MITTLSRSNPRSAFGPRFYQLAFSNIQHTPGQHVSYLSTKQIKPNQTSKLETLFYSASTGSKLLYSPHLSYETLPLDDVVDILKGVQSESSNHLETGLSNQQAEKLLAEVGPNALPSKKQASIWKLWLQQFDDSLVKVLVGVSILSAVFSALEAWDVLLENTNESTEFLSTYISDAKLRSHVMQSFLEPGVIVAILFFNAAVGVWQDLSVRSSLEALENMQPKLATVLRYEDIGGTSNWVSDYDAQFLVPGDIIKLRVGDSIPADARLIEISSSTMYVDESSLTGESASVDKLPGDEGLKEMNNIENVVEKKPAIQDQTSMLFASSLVTRGSGNAIIVRTGIDTQIGKIQSTLLEAQSETYERKTPLGERLDELGTKLSYIIGLICAVVWITSVPRMSDHAFDTWFEGAIYYAKTSVALGVAAIPEGLPAVITLCLSLGTRRMAKRNVIVRKLPSVETLGCTSVICTDKTGTLTSNQMTGVSIVLLETTTSHKDMEVVGHQISGNSYNPSGSVADIDRDESINIKDGGVKFACDIMTLCNDARLIGNDDWSSSDSNPKYFIEGEPTEAALAVVVEKLGPYNTNDRTLDMRPSFLANQNKIHFESNWERYATLEFDRQRKRMSVLCSAKGAIAQSILFCKGAPNVILQHCSHGKLRDGRVIPLNPKLVSQIEDSICSIGDQALRCIGLAFKEGKDLDHVLLQENGHYDTYLKESSRFEAIEQNMIFVGLVAIRDPPRPFVSDSVDVCLQAGIRVMMITGDIKATAVAIAKAVNIFSKNDDAVPAFEGREFFTLPESKQLELLSENLVICRAEPKDKQRLVKMLQSIGEVPAMTGDGINDAPALQQASIGVAMGISGTDVAKEAADMILVDDNFSSIVDAVQEGRCIYVNIQAFINFLITCNIGEVIGVFLASILGLPSLLTPLQLLWANLVTDGPPAIALGFNPPEPELMNKNPRLSSEEILTQSLLVRYTIVGLYIGIATLGVYISYFLDSGVSLHEVFSWSSCMDFPVCEIYSDIHRPQTLALTTLVTTELLKALCTVSAKFSIFVVPPQRNPWLLLGVTVPFALNLVIIYNPSLGEIFGLVPLSSHDWMKILLWSFPIIIIEEGLKFYDSRFKEDCIR